MNSAEDEDDVPSVFLLGKTYLLTNDNFYIRKDPFVHMSAGDRHSILVTEDGRTYAFGDNNSGQLGLGHTNPVKSVSCIKSLQFTNTDEKVLLVACGRESSIVATNYGSLYSFGSNNHCQLGFESDESCAIHSSPIQLDSFHSEISWKQISMGAEHTCALTNDGIVYTWGSNEDGQCGHARKYDHITKPKKLLLDYNVSTISCGYYHTALIDEDGRLFLFGNNDNRQLGRSTTENDVGPLEVSLPEPITDVACGNQYTIVLTESGKIYICGRGDRGQLGLGSRILSIEYFEPIERNVPTVVTAVATGEGHTAILGSHNDLYVFGDGKHGKLSYETQKNEFEPCSIDLFEDYNVLSAVCGGCQTLVIAQKRSLTDKDDTENRKDFELQSFRNSARILQDSMITTRLSTDNTTEHDEPVDESDHERNSLLPNGSDSDGMSASGKSELMNTTHVQKNGLFQSIRPVNTKVSQMIKAGALDHSVPLINVANDLIKSNNSSLRNIESPNHRTESIESSSENVSDDETNNQSTPAETLDKETSQQVLSEKKIDYYENVSDLSTTISRSSSASSSDDNGSVASGSVDDLHRSFYPPQKLKLNNDASKSLTTMKSEPGFFSKHFGTNSTKTTSTTGNNNSRLCVIL